MNKYEVMFIVRPDSSEEEKKTLFSQINDAVTKNNGKVTEANIWSEKRRLFFPLKKHTEGVYYLMHITIDPLLVKELRHAYKLNEGILRVLIIKVE